MPRQLVFAIAICRFAAAPAMPRYAAAAIFTPLPLPPCPDAFSRYYDDYDDFHAAIDGCHAADMLRR